MTSDGTHAYYRKPRDTIMWAEFDSIAGRLGLPRSSAVTEAAREWVEKHRDDPRPPVPIPAKGGRPRIKPYPPDPFA